MASSMINMQDFGESQKRQMPVILILDASGSMIEDGRIEALNRGVRGLLAELAKTRTMTVEFWIAIVVFKNDEAYVHQEYTLLHNMHWTDIRQSGCTPLASALDKAKEIIEDKSKLLTNAYRPTVILISDGYPTDDDSVWKDAMRRFTKEGRTANCDRFALAVDGAAKEVLEQFVVNPKSHMINANDSTMIVEFMRWLSSSVATASTSQNPNKKEPHEDLQKEVEAVGEILDPNFGDKVDLEELLNG